MRPPGPKRSGGWSTTSVKCGLVLVFLALVYMSATVFRVPNEPEPAQSQPVPAGPSASDHHEALAQAMDGVRSQLQQLQQQRQHQTSAPAPPRPTQAVTGFFAPVIDKSQSTAGPTVLPVPTRYPSFFPELKDVRDMRAQSGVWRKDAALKPSDVAGLERLRVLVYKENFGSSLVKADQGGPMGEIVLFRSLLRTSNNGNSHEHACGFDGVGSTLSMRA
jgi:hypothetical protein